MATVKTIWMEEVGRLQKEQISLRGDLTKARRDRDCYRKRWRREQQKREKEEMVSAVGRRLIDYQNKLKDNANDKAAKLNSEVSQLSAENDRFRRRVAYQSGQISDLHKENTQLHAEVRHLCKILTDDGWSPQDFFRAGQTELLREQRKRIAE